MDEPEVRHDPERHSYELVVDGSVVGVADYRPDGAADVFFHTEVSPRLRGRGLAAVLVRAALDDARARGRRVIPSCWYVADFIRDHPEYEDLLAA